MSCAIYMHHYFTSVLAEWRSLAPRDKPEYSPAPGRPTNRWSTPISCSVFSCITCVLVGGADCALLGGLMLRLNLTVIGIGVDRVEITHPPVTRGAD